MTTLHQRIETATNWLSRSLPAIPGTALVLGSGLGTWLDPARIRFQASYAEIPGFPVSTVLGHAGTLSLTELGGAPLLVLSGRFHFYEGYSLQEVTLFVRCLALLGISNLILTNAAGALNPVFDTGGLMLLTDHINMMGANPLTGPNQDAWGPRFPDMSQVYCPVLGNKALDAARANGQRVERGVYVAVAGPSLETPAETRMYRILGADAIGMSTVPEAIVGHHMGLKILGISCLTNKNLPDCMAATSHEEILDQARQSSAALGGLLTALIPKL